MHAHLDFSLELHRQIAPAPERSFCWSPYSVASTLGLVAEATGGATRDELVTALRCSHPGEELAGTFSQAADLAAATSAGAEEPVLAVVNTLWVHRGLPIAKAYRRGLGNWPGSAVRNAPFQEAPEQARQRINAEVSDTTRELVPELLAPDSVDPDTVAALVNALYLKASWRQSFDERATEPRIFHAPGRSHDVETMRAHRRFGYAARKGWQAVSLPAAGDVEAVVLLPDGALSPAETALGGEELNALLVSLEQHQVELFLPKFEVTGGAELRQPLSRLGVRRLFTRDADFSGLTEHPLRVSTAVHESVLRVDERGLEGATGTAAVIMPTSVVQAPEPIRVEVNRPFLLVVRHRATGTLYFVARVVDPA